MVERIGIGKDSLLAREALRAAQRVAAERVAPEGVAPAPLPASGAPAAGAPQGVDFERALEAGLERIDGEVRSADTLPFDLLTGKVDDFHEIAVQLKSAELSFRFAMEIRNKLIDAYREVMRMSV
jgi:flagellar hook-basal body complex protein FliE